MTWEQRTGHSLRIQSNTCSTGLIYDLEETGCSKRGSAEQEKEVRDKYSAQAEHWRQEMKCGGRRGSGERLTVGQKQTLVESEPRRLNNCLRKHRKSWRDGNNIQTKLSSFTEMSNELKGQGLFFSVWVSFNVAKWDTRSFREAQWKKQWVGSVASLVGEGQWGSIKSSEENWRQLWHHPTQKGMDRVLIDFNQFLYRTYWRTYCLTLQDIFISSVLGIGL